MDWWTTYIEPIREAFRGYSFREWCNMNCFSNNGSNQSISDDIPNIESNLEESKIPEIKSQNDKHNYSFLEKDKSSETKFDHRVGQCLSKVDETKEGSSHPIKIGKEFSDLRIKEGDIKKFN